MGFKALFGLAVIPAAMLGGLVIACLSRRMRDLFFVCLVFFSPMIERMDVNFVSREWYRGTSRGFEFSLLDILSFGLLFSSLLAPRRGETRAYWPGSLGFMLLLLAYACFNVAISDPRLFGLFELFKMARGLVVFLAVAFYIRSERELRLMLWTLACLVCYEGLLALQQRYMYGIHRVPGTIDDSNSLSVFMCTTAPVFVAVITSRLPLLLKGISAAAIALACVGVILTISRAGVVIVALVLLGTALCTMSWRLSLKKILILLLIVAGAAGMLGKSWKTLKERFQSSSLKEEYENKKNLGRGYYIRIARAIVHEEWFGVGLNNWSYWVSNRYGPKLGYRFVPYRGTDTEPSDKIPATSNVDEAQAAPAHSLAALTAGELGIPGLALFALLWLRWFTMGASFLWRRTPDPKRRIAVGILFGLCGMFLQSLTEWVFRQSPLYYVFHVLLGTLAALCYHRKRTLLQARSAQAAPAPIPAEVWAPPLSHAPLSP
jgi:hypothetical protein